LLGLDLAERLVADAAVLEGRIAKRVKKSPDLQEVERLEVDLEEKQSQIDREVQELGSLENPRQQAHERLIAAEEHFSKVGGQHWEQRETRQRELAEVDLAVKAAEEQLVGLAATELPLALISGLLGTVAEQTQQEHAAAESQAVTGILVDRDEALLELLKTKRVAARSIKIVEDFTERDRARRAAGAEVDGRLRVSRSGRRLVQHLLEIGLKQRVRTANELLTAVENGRRRKEDLQRALAAVPDETSLQDVVGELKAASTELASFDQKVAKYEKQLVALRAERNQIEGELAKLRRKVVDEQIRTEESARIGHLLVRTQDTMKTFLRKATHSKIDRLSQLISESFRFLLRKKTLVQRVQIDPETFAITLFDDQGQRVSKGRLSEGEKQIFAIAVLWGLSRASARPLPTIIDTPMARLDAQHRHQLVERYFPNASHQVVILSTDTEVDRQYYEQLQPHVARAYHLNYSERQKLTVAEEGYFWDREPVMETEEALV
jgi:DNA sulfur modification protein DndD